MMGRGVPPLAPPPKHYSSSSDEDVPGLNERDMSSADESESDDERKTSAVTATAKQEQGASFKDDPMPGPILDGGERKSLHVFFSFFWGQGPAGRAHHRLRSKGPAGPDLARSRGTGVRILRGRVAGDLRAVE